MNRHLGRMVWLTLGSLLVGASIVHAGTWVASPLASADVFSVAVAPSNPAILYAAVRFVGVFKSTDTGATWDRTHLTSGYVDGVNHVYADVMAIGVDPANADIAYTLTVSGGNSLLKTTDGGDHWADAGAGLASDGSVSTFALNPLAPSSLYAGTTLGKVFKTTNGGVSWADASVGLPEAGIKDIAFDPTSALVVYVATEAGVYRSSDAGATWSAATSGLGSSLQALAIDPSTPSTLYAAGNQTSKSTDSGASWTLLGNSPAPVEGGELASTHDIAVDPNAPSTLYVAHSPGGMISRSTDAGATWSPLSVGINLYATHQITLDSSSPGRLYVGTSTGVLRSTTAGDTWNLSTAGLLARSVDAIAFDPLNPAVVYVGTETAGVFKSTDGGSSWVAVNAGLTGFGLRVPALAIDPLTTTNLYAATDGAGLFKSIDGAAHWSQTLAGASSHVVIDPIDPTTVYTTAGAAIKKSTDGGSTWVVASSGLPVSGVVLSLAIDPTTPSTLFSGAQDGFYRSTDAAATWQKVDTHTGPYAFAVDPIDPDLVYAASGVGPWKSTDGGGSWGKIGSNLAINACVLNPTRPQNLLTAGPWGVKVSSNAGATLSDLNTGLGIRSAAAAAVSALGRAAVGTIDGVYFLQATCGDGVLDFSEQCDDGNTTAGDCCSPTCTIEANGTSCDDGLYCNGADSCSGGTCTAHVGDPCAAGPECQNTCNEAANNCIVPGTPCSDEGDACTPDECNAIGSCAHLDGDGDGIGDRCDNCSAIANGDQANSDCPDPLFVSSGGCNASQPALPGCCDGGDVCDACPFRSDNGNCNGGGTVAASIGNAGGSLTTPDGTLDVVIPSGALNDTRSISISSNGLDAESGAVAASITAGPPGTTFTAPVTFTFHWADRDGDGRVDVGRCVGGTDDGLSCGRNTQCPGGSCSSGDTDIAEADLLLKHDGQRISLNGINVAPFRCADHDAASSACASTVADCNDAPGSGQSVVAQCCSPTTNQWKFQTCAFSQFLLSLREADLVPGRGSVATDCFAEWGPENPYNTPKFEDPKPRPPKAAQNRGVLSFVQTCVNGDPTCDQDGLASNCSCALALKVAINVADTRLKDRNGAAACVPAPVASWSLGYPLPDDHDLIQAGNAQRLRDAVKAATGGITTGDHQEGVQFAVPLTADIDSAAAWIEVPLSKQTKVVKAPGKLTMKMVTQAVPLPGESKGLRDKDKLKVICLPSGQEPDVCP